MDNKDDFIHLIENDLSPEDLKNLIQSLDTESGRRDLSDQMDILLSRLESEDTDSYAKYDREAILKDINNKLKKKRIYKAITLSTIITGIFILGFLTSVFIFYRQKNYEEVGYSQINVQKGEGPLFVIFQDGTKVILNADSELIYPIKFNHGKRKVFLKGEAYFDVVNENNNVFSVDLGESEVEVLGTSFNIKNYPIDSLTIVTLDEGKIDFICDGKNYIMKPNEELKYNHKTKEEPEISYNYLSYRNSLWRNHQIVFDKTSMLEVLNTISRFYNIKYLIKDPSLNNITYTYTSSNKGEFLPLDSLLQDLEIISDVKFTRNGDCIEVNKINI